VDGKRDGVRLAARPRYPVAGEAPDEPTDELEAAPALDTDQ